jgi:cytochrome bd ubiquinol oxidase subunit II
MLLALIFRGVAFEFRWRTQRGKFLWDWASSAARAGRVRCQGIALGALVQGIRSRPRLCRRLVGLAHARSAC